MQRSSLSTRTQSPQGWKKKSSYYRRPSGRPYGRKPKKFKLPKIFLYIPLSKNFFKAILMLVGLGVAFGGIASLFILGWIAKDLPNPNRIIDRTVAQSTKIYDRTGETLLFNIYGNEKRTLVELTDIPEHVVQATLVAEDREFYTHRGISITGIIRSAIRNLTTGSREGGSTLTQQLVKNAILSPEKTYTRKIKEIILSWQIEKRFSKDEILQLYFNEIPYGSVAYGAEAGAQTYFSKSIKDISLAEAAILAALPQAPTYYSPYGSNVDALIGRQGWILDSMAELGYITETDAEFAKNEKLEFNQKRDDITAPHFVMYVREYLTEKYGELTVEQGGLQVLTTLDMVKQTLAEKVIAEGAESNLSWEASNAALVAIDTKTGQIIAMVGSKDFFDEEIDGQVNVTIRPRQPGSSFKPVVYTAAFIKGYTPDTVLYDVETKFLNYDGKDYEPKNYDLKQRGPVTITKALAGSLNIPAVKAIYLTGVDNVIDLAEDLGYTTLSDRSRFGLSLVLGGGEVTLLEHVNAFSALAREGEYHPPVAILEVKDKDGNILEEYKKKEKKVLSSEIARLTNKILSDNGARAYVFGENNHLTLGGRPVAAKTGTTNDYRDAWTIGYTPSLAVGVWVGNNDNSAMKRGAAGGVVAAPIWNSFMRQILGDTPFENFKEPKGIETSKPALNGSITEGIKVKIDKATGKLATSLTPESQVEEKIFKQTHSILHWVSKDDPQGSSKPNQSGEQYTRWEEAIALWAEDNNIISEEPPTEFDDLHNAANRPSVNITAPNNSQIITSRTLNASVSVSAPRGVARVEYYINNQLLKNITSPPFSLNVFIEDPAIQTGSYTLKAIAYDDIDNSNSASIELNMQLPAAPPTLTWVSPTAGQTISLPFSIQAELNNVANIDKIDLFYRAGDQENYINTIRQFPGGKLLAQWPSAPAGGYTLYAQITNQAGFSYKSDEVEVIVK